MAQGKLVAASSVGGHRELIEDGVNGTLFAPDDPAALAQAIAGLLGNRAGWDERRTVARRFVERAHDWGFNARRYLSVYQAVVASKGEAAPIAA
jgi:glycosyltransferase involved in cell wall biosynthesis